MISVGIDIGTSSLKLLALNENGEIIKTIKKKYEVQIPKDGYCEQDPEIWYTSTLEAFNELLENKYLVNQQIDSITFSGQMHTLVILDENDKVIRPAILWNDSRSYKQSEYLNNIIGKEKLIQETGNISFAGFTLPKLLWLRENEIENFKKISKVMLPKDYLIYKFTNVFATDVSDASGTLLFDVENKIWSNEILSICSLEQKNLPKIFESYDLVSTVDKILAKELGISENTKVFAGGADNSIAAISMNCVSENSINISLGTSGTILIPKNNFIRPKNNTIHNFCSSNSKYYHMSCILNAANCYKWWKEKIIRYEFNILENYDLSNILNNKIIFSPYLTGERSPHNDSDIRACFIGLNANTKQQDMTLAILEGVCFALRECLEYMLKDITLKGYNITVCGGGSKNEIWLKILASILNKELYIHELDHGPSLGAAIIGLKDKVDYTKINKVLKVVEPEAEFIEHYNKKYEVYKKIYPALQTINRE